MILADAYEFSQENPSDSDEEDLAEDEAESKALELAAYVATRLIAPELVAL